MYDNDIANITTSAWREKVYIETTEHIICGYVFMPKIGKKSRLLSEILNSNKNFLAVKDCTLEYKLFPSKTLEKHDFMQINICILRYYSLHKSKYYTFLFYLF